MRGLVLVAAEHAGQPAAARLRADALAVTSVEALGL